MAIKKQVDISVDAKQAISQMDELGSSFEDVFGEVKPLNTKIGEMEDALYQLAAAGDTSSKEFKDLSRTIGDYKKVIIDTDMHVDAMAQTSSQNLGGAIEGVSGAFAIGTGAMGAFGVESEAVGEALLRVQSAMAITQGISSIRESTKAFKGLKESIMKNSVAQKILSGVTIAFTVVQKVLNTAFKANPIGVIVIAVTALIAGVMALINPVKNLIGFFFGMAEATESAAEANERLEKSHAKADAARKKRNKETDTSLNHEIALLKAKGATEEKIRKEEAKNAKKRLSDRKTDAKEIKKQIDENKQNYFKALEEEDFELAKSIREKNEQKREELKSLKKLDGDYYRNKEILREQEKVRKQKEIDDDIDENKAKWKQILADRKAAAKQQLDTEREIEDARLANQEESEAKEQELNRISFERFREDTLANTELTEKQKQDLIDAAGEKARLKRIEIGEKYKAIDEQAIADAKIADEEKAALDLETLKARLDAESEIKKQALEKQVADNKEAEEEKKAQQERTAEAATQGLNAIGDIANIMFDSQLEAAEGNEVQQEKIRKKAFLSNKAIQLSLAVVDGFKSITASLAQSPIAIGPVPNPAGIQSLAFAALSSGINIAKIAATKYKGGAKSINTPTPNISGGGVSTPQFNVVGNSPENQLAQSLGQQNNQTVKAFVVAGDVTTAQGLERNAIKTASL